MRKLYRGILIFSVLCMLLLAVPVVSAQELIEAVDGDDSGIIGIDREVFIGLAIVVGFLVQGVFLSVTNKNFDGLLQAYEKTLNDKSVRSAAEHTYMTTSLPVREFINILRSGVLVLDKLDIADDIVDPLADFIGDVTDGDLST